jgi:hypothetical protein
LELQENRKGERPRTHETGILLQKTKKNPRTLQHLPSPSSAARTPAVPVRKIRLFLPGVGESLDITSSSCMSLGVYAALDPSWYW